MFFPFSDYTTTTIGSSQGDTLKYTAPYRCMIILQITAMERNNKYFGVYTPVGGDQARRDYLIHNNVIDGRISSGFGLTRILDTGDQLWGDNDLSPFGATIHIFRFPEQI